MRRACTSRAAPRTETELVTQVAGEVVWVSPALVPGGFFEAGEVLLRIDDADYAANLESALAALERVKGTMLEARGLSLITENADEDQQG